MQADFPQKLTEKDLMVAALDLPAEERQAYVEKMCQGRNDLAQRVLELIIHADNPDSFMAAPYLRLTSTKGHESIKVGTQIDRYRLMEQIGEGGMGVVFVAEQTEPVRRKVALKVIKPGMDSKSVIARFEAERQALAMMDHPNIARVLDAGTTAERLPYFVMELVRGISITDYCDQARATLDVRLQLFIDVCLAVQHAHQKGIIHRDLKPGNILITLHDGTPVVKVIDFGVAKALHQQLTDSTVYTSLNQVIGTPLYMSPEQMELSGLDIDTRSDVYSLGVLLYELVCGTTPYDRERLLRSGWDEMRRIVREEDPPRPSDRINTLSEKESSTIAERRGLDHRTLVKSIRSELDWIIIRSLEKDRNRRYCSTAELADDVGRYLKREAVQACPPSWTYRVKKVLRRYRIAAFICGAVFVGLLIGLIATTWQWRRAVDAEAAKADLLSLADEREKLANARLTMAETTIDVMYTEFATVWLNAQTGQSARQKEFLEKAIASYRQLAEQSPVDAAPRPKAILARIRAGQLLSKIGMFEKALEEFNTSYDMALVGKLSNPDLIDYRLLMCKCQTQRGNVYSNRGDNERKLQCIDEALDELLQISEQPNLTDEQQKEVHIELTNCALSYSSEETRKDKAKLAADKSLEFGRRFVAARPDDSVAHAQLAKSLGAKGQTLLWWGKENDECAAVYRESTALLKQIIGKDAKDPEASQSLINAMNNLEIALNRLNRKVEAEAVKKERAVLLRSFVSRFPDNLRLKADLGEQLRLESLNLRKEGKRAESRKSQEESIQLLEQLIRDFPEYKQGRLNYIRTVRQAGGNATKDGDLEMAKHVFRKAQDFADKVLQEFPDDMEFLAECSYATRQLAVLELELNNPREAFQALRVVFQYLKQEKETNRGTSKNNFSFLLGIAGITASCDSLSEIAVRTAREKWDGGGELESFAADVSAFQADCRAYRRAAFDSWRRAGPDFESDWSAIAGAISVTDAWAIVNRPPSLTNFREDSVVASHEILLKELLFTVLAAPSIPDYWADIVLAISSCPEYYGRDSEIAIRIEAAANRLPDSPNAERAQAWICFREKRFNEAIERLKDLDDIPEDHLIRSMALAKMGRVGGANEEFEKAQSEVQATLNRYAEKKKTTKTPFQPNAQTLLRLQDEARKLLKSESEPADTSSSK
ncbi:MAG: serine/threonine-protein kinase [Pirellulales bacterium]